MSRRYLITAGPTREPIDPVRYIANRSSGAMGIALARAAHAAGHEVTLLLGPMTAEPPAEVRTIRFETTADLAALLDECFEGCEVLVMAAAVADYRPAAACEGKLERRAGTLTIELEATPDLVAACAARRRPHQFILGFALAEAEYLSARAADKLERKGLDGIVANRLETMGAADTTATVHTPDGQTHRPPRTPLDKPTFARWLIDWIDQSQSP